MVPVSVEFDNIVGGQNLFSQYSKLFQCRRRAIQYFVAAIFYQQYQTPENRRYVLYYRTG